MDTLNFTMLYVKYTFIKDVFNICIFQLIHRALVCGREKRSQMKSGVDGKDRGCADGMGASRKQATRGSAGHCQGSGDQAALLVQRDGKSTESEGKDKCRQKGREGPEP